MSTKQKNEQARIAAFLASQLPARPVIAMVCGGPIPGMAPQNPVPEHLWNLWNLTVERYNGAAVISGQWWIDAAQALGQRINARDVFATGVTRNQRPATALVFVLYGDPDRYEVPSFDSVAKAITKQRDRWVGGYGLRVSIPLDRDAHAVRRIW